jgi:two-component system, OmpR family, response regulator
MRVLVVEDEDRIASFLDKGLTAHGYAVHRASTGAEALDGTMTDDVDIAILDLTLPDMDGLHVLDRWRGQGMSAPVIVLTARDQPNDRVRGLDLGADDYMPKPFDFDELLARIRARLRPSKGPSSTLRAHNIEFDLLTRRVTVDGEPAELTWRESALLEEFMRHPDQVLSREQLMSRVWNIEFDPGSNVVDVYVGYLRRKLGEAAIETVRGAGYRLVVDRNASCDER